MAFFSGVMVCDVKPKGRPRFSKWGGAYTPKPTRDFEKLVSDWATQSMGKKEPTANPIRVKLSIYIRRPKSNKTKQHAQTPDVDNLAKAILDAINEIVFVDDKQIIELEISKYWADFVEPSFTITIYEINL
jgi:Holliday junction resolvase RusA-like endonuclease